MRYTQENCRIVSIKHLTPQVCDILIEAKDIASVAKAGQFVHISCKEYSLRRPISICSFDANQGLIRLVCENRGKGTEWLNSRQAGDLLDVIGPLGHGFPLTDPSKKAVMIGGGIGTPPLLPIAHYYQNNATVITGFRNRNAVILQDDFRSAGANVCLCTDDGSAGFHGFTTQVLEQIFAHNHVDVVYTCGPKMMMKKIAEMAKDRGIECYVSMEERMACGIGACLGCTCKTKDDNGKTNMTRVCLNGPVFRAEEVDWT